MNIQDILQQARQFQENMQGLQKKLGDRQVSGSAGGGMITVTVNGRGEVLGLEIDPVLISSDERAMLQDLIVAAVNDALHKAREMGREEMSRLTGGLQIPGMF